MNSMAWVSGGIARGEAARCRSILARTKRCSGREAAAALPTRDRFLLNWPRHTFCLMRAVPRLADAVCPGAEIEGHGFQRRTGPRQIGAAACQSRLRFGDGPCAHGGE